jgi:hypothetical protein
MFTPFDMAAREMILSRCDGLGHRSLGQQDLIVVMQEGGNDNSLRCGCPVVHAGGFLTKAYHSQSE